MRVLVTGACGFVGSHIVESLLAAGHTPIAIDDLSTGRIENLPGGVELIIRKVQDVAVLPDHEAIIHAAAYADLRANWDSRANRIRLLEENVRATMCALEWCRPGVPFVFLSSASVYGSQCADGGVVRESSPVSLESPYAASKLACEAFVESYGRARAFPWYSLRLVNQVGARTAHGVIGDFVRMARGGMIHAKDDGRQRKSWVHVKDTADACTALCAGRAPSGVYNMTSPQDLSWRDIIHAMGWEGPLTWEERAGGAVGDPVGLHCDGAKLESWTGARRDVLQGVREALESLGWGS